MPKRPSSPPGPPPRWPVSEDRQVTISITLLGTGGPIPAPDRAGPATLVSAGDEHYLVDAGRGVLMRLAAAGLGAPQLSAVLITHLHSDHITDLNDVITTRWVMTFETDTADDRRPGRDPGRGRSSAGVARSRHPLPNRPPPRPRPRTPGDGGRGRRRSGRPRRCDHDHLCADRPPARRTERRVPVRARRRRSRHRRRHRAVCRPRPAVRRR